MRTGYAGEQHHAEPDNNCRTEVRLESHQNEDYPRVRAGNKNVADVRYLDMPAGKILGKSDNEHQLYKLNGLERERAEVKPRTRSFYRGTDNNKNYERQKYRHKERSRDGASAQKSPVYFCRYKKYRHSCQNPSCLPQKKRILPLERVHGKQPQKRQPQCRAEGYPVY